MPAALGFWKGAIYQWINPKAWIVLLGAVTGYSNDMTTIVEIISIAFLYAIIGFPCVMLWAVLGDKLAHFLKQDNRMQIFNRSMGVLLALSLVPILMM
jgi:threonine/homoserine/homoserine lactone efflux protein